MPWRYFGHAKVDPTSPTAAGQCDRCDCTYSLNQLQWELQWRGLSIQRTGFRVCPRCFDTPAEFLKPLLLPADPQPVPNPRVNHNYAQMNEGSFATQWDMSGRWDAEGGGGVPLDWQP